MNDRRQCSFFTEWVRVRISLHPDGGARLPISQIRIERRRTFAVAAALLGALFFSGCGTTMNRQATEQLLMSHAVDTSIARIPFEDLMGRKIFFDTQFIKPVKGIGFVNSNYIIAAMRERMITSGCLLQDSRDEADIIVEARVGALATQSHEVTYGIPASRSLSMAASIVTTLPAVPTIPEVSFAKRNNQLAASKIGVFAFERESKHPVWQSGISQATSTANEYYLLGAGPFQRGSIYQGTQFAGSKLRIPMHDENGEQIAAKQGEASESAAPVLLHGDSATVQAVGFETPSETGSPLEP